MSRQHEERSAGDESSATATTTTAGPAGRVVIPNQVLEREERMVSFRPEGGETTTGGAVLVLHQALLAHDPNVKRVFVDKTMEWFLRVEDADEHTERGMSLQAEQILTDVIQEFEQLRDKFRREHEDISEDSWVFHCHTEEIGRSNRAFLRITKKDYFGALQDFTAALQSSQYTGKQPPTLDDYTEKGESLYFRFRCFEGLLQDDPLNVDLINGLLTNMDVFFACARACPTLIDEPKQKNMIDFLLKRTVQQKILEMKESGNFSRPIFSQNDRRDLEKTVGRSLFAKGFSYTCMHCGKLGTQPGVTLRSCSECEQAWFCGRPCQKKEWKSHRKDCKLSVPRPLVWKDDMKETTMKEISEKLAHCGTSGGDGEFVFAVRDPATGRIFDAIRDADIYFYPSEQSLLDAYAEKVKEKAGVEFQLKS